MRMRIMRRSLTLLFLAGACVQASASDHAAPRQVVREQRTLTVQGTRETWRLVWDGTPATVCGPEEMETAVTCPCSGWAFAEYGKLSLVRSRGGRDIERLDLRPLFGKFDDPDAKTRAGAAYLQRWPMKLEDMDRQRRGDPKLVEDIKQRNAPEIINLADYNRDGAATEFLMQVGTLPCGKHQFVAIGVTKSNPHLHALTSVAHPDTPLVMPLPAWQALLSGARPTAVTVWPCGDHGSEVRSELIVSAMGGEIRVKDREYACPPPGAAEKLIREFDV